MLRAYIEIIYTFLIHILLAIADLQRKICALLPSFSDLEKLSAYFLAKPFDAERLFQVLELATG